MSRLRYSASPSTPWPQFVLVALVTLIALAGWTLYTRAEARRHAATEASRSGSQVAQAVAREHERLIEGARQLLVGLAQRSEVQTHNTASCRVLFASVLRAFPFYLDAVAAEPNGGVFCAGRPPAIAGGSLLDRETVRLSAETGNLTLGPYTIDRVSQKATIPLAAPSVDDAGVVRAVVVLWLDLTWLSRTLIETPLVGASLAVVDRHGLILVHHPEPERWTGEVLPEPIMNAILAKSEGVAEGPDLDGLASTFVFTPLLRDVTRAGDATVMVALPHSAVFRDADRLFRVHLVGLGIVAILLLVTAGFAFDLFVGRPLHVLARLVHRLSTGDWSARPGLVQAGGGLGQLTRAFDGLAGKLEEQRHEVTFLEQKLASMRAAVPAARSSPAAAPAAPPAAPRPAASSQPAVRRTASAPASDAYWGCTEAPFDNSPNPKFLYPSPNHEEILRRLAYAVRRRKGCVVLTGEPGCGKTMLIRAMIHRLDPSRHEIGYLTNPTGDSLDLLRGMLYELGLETEERRRAELRHLLSDLVIRNFKNDRRTLIIADDAQLVSDDRWFEEMSLLLNLETDEQGLVTILLVGSPELTPKIQAATHLAHRVAFRCRVNPLDEAHTAKYIDHRLSVAGQVEPIFSPDALQVIFDATHGVPREINNLCENALMIGHERGLREIDAEDIRHVMSETTSSPEPEAAQSSGPAVHPLRVIRGKPASGSPST